MLREASCALSLVYALPHELTHYAVARSQTDDAAFEVEVFGTGARAFWEPLDSARWEFVAFLAPTILGCLLAALWVVTGATIDGWRLPAALGLALYTVPSPADVRGALGRMRGESEEPDRNN